MRIINELDNLLDASLSENGKLAKLLLQANETITGLRSELATAINCLRNIDNGDFEEDEDRHDTDY